MSLTRCASYAVMEIGAVCIIRGVTYWPKPSSVALIMYIQIAIASCSDLSFMLDLNVCPVEVIHERMHCVFELPPILVIGITSKTKTSAWNRWREINSIRCYCWRNIWIWISYCRTHIVFDMMHQLRSIIILSHTYCFWPDVPVTQLWSSALFASYGESHTDQNPHQSHSSCTTDDSCV